MFKFSKVSSLAIAAAVVASASAASAKPALQVVDGAVQLSDQEKATVTGKSGCLPPPPPCAPPPPPPSCPPPAPSASKPGYGFGTTGHYGPPGQGFTATDNWRNHAAGDGLTPSGRALPPRAFK